LGTHAYIADDFSGLQVIDITNPLNPQIVGSVNTPGRAVGVAVSGSYAYISDLACGLQVIDVTNPASPQIIGSLDTPAGAFDVIVFGTYALVSDGNSGLQILPAQCTGTSGVEDHVWDASGVVVSIYPNPSSSSALIHFAMPSDGHARASIYDVAGRHIRTLFDETLSAGPHHFLWDGKDESGRGVAAGIYLIRVSTVEESSTARLVMVR
jgi:hypothetical protein